MLKLFDCSNEADELRANAVKESEQKERIEEKLNATNNELSSVKKELDELKTERDALRKELELVKTENIKERSISPILKADTTEIFDQQKRISDLEAQLAFIEMQLKDKDIIIMEMTELKVKLNDVERELRQTKSNDLYVEGDILEKKKELATTQKALVGG